MKRLFEILAALLLSAIVLYCLLAALGISGRINTGGGEPKTAAFTASVLAHTLGGFALTLVSLFAGAALAQRVWKTEAADFAAALLYGFPLSLIIQAAAAAISLTVPRATWPLGIALFALAAVPLLAKSVRLSAVRALETACLLLPPALLFGGWMALQWHGPTQSLPGSPVGDTVFYATNMHALHLQAWPLANLGMEGETFGNYFNQLHTAVGAGVMHAAPIDPFQWLLGGMGAAFILTHGLLFWAYLKAAPPPAITPVNGALAISVFYIAHRGGRAGSVTAAVFAVAGSLLGKVSGAAAIAGFAFARLAPQISKSRGAFFNTAIAFAAITALLAVWLIYAYGPVMLRADYLGTYGYVYLVKYKAPLAAGLPWLLRDSGMVLLAVGVWRLFKPLEALSLSLSLSLALIYPYLFFAAFIGACVIIALKLIATPRLATAWHALFLIAALFCISAVALLDVAGRFNGVIWILSLGGALVLALLAARGDPARNWKTSAAAWMMALSTGLGTLAVAQGNWIVDSGWRQGRPPDLTAEVFDIWHAVRTQTPRDAIVFTDQTGPDATLLGSWNGYAASGGRQVFVANMNGTHHFQGKKDRIGIALACNSAVLDETIAPGAAGYRRDYGSVYAVAKSDRSFSPAWQQVYANANWHLWRWQGGGVSETAQATGDCARLLAIRESSAP